MVKRILKRGADKIDETVKAGTGGHYKSFDSPEGEIASKTVNRYLGNNGQGGYSEKFPQAKELNTGMKRLSDVGGWGMGNYQNAAMKEGRSALGLASKHAVQGAATGGLAGGTVEASQGGSFWDGAKQGAFNGAVGMTAIRGAKRMSGADTYFGKNGVKASATNMWKTTSNDSQVSGQAVALLSQKQRDGMVRAVMNGNAKK